MSETMILIDNTFLDNRKARYDRRLKKMVPVKGQRVTEAYFFCQEITETKRSKKTKKFIHTIKCNGQTDLAVKMQTFIKKNNAVINRLDG